MNINSKKGFTLIELLVVIAIIGILSSVVLASLNSARQKSRDARRVSDIAQIQLALELYFDSCGQYPNTLTTATAVGCSGGTSLGDFLSPMPTDPVTDVVFYYYAVGSAAAAVCLDYHLGATMEDGGHTVLGSDADTTVAPTPLCTGSDGFVSGADPVYDLTP
ncbi:type II secretion system protein [Patescibacteria group bacterium]|nr:type II secretion system protein [Patescibacteria group bacterium]